MCWKNLRKEEFDRNQYLQRPRNTMNQLPAKIRQQKIADIQGLDKAYADKLCIYYKNGNLYIAGTRDFGDVIDDIKLHLPNGARLSQRYHDVIKYLKDNLDMKVENVIGHSLGGAVTKQLQTD